jgi:hypothetical protein
MNSMRRKIALIFLVILAAVVLIPTIVGVSTALADVGYEINWWTVDSGGGVSESSGGQYALKGTIGQYDTSAPTEGGTYSLRSGFWVEGILDLLDFIIHLPLVLK